MAVTGIMSGILLFALQVRFDGEEQGYLSVWENAEIGESSVYYRESKGPLSCLKEVGIKKVKTELRKRDILGASGNPEGSLPSPVPGACARSCG